MEKKLQKLLLEKSQEAFLLALEIYNKPTIKFKLEGFCFFICNAWELLLKSYLLKQGKSIYYKDKKKMNRTISLTKAIDLVLTNSKDPLRKNLEFVISLRNMSTHLIIPEYAYICNDVFLACVKNYTTKLKDYMNVTIDEKFNVDFLTMFIPKQNNTSLVFGKYSKKILEKYNSTKKNLENAYRKFVTKDNNVNEKFAITYELSFKRVKDLNDADVTVTKAKPENAQYGLVTEVNTDDISKYYPLSNKQIIEKVNEEFHQIGITFVPATENAKNKFTTNSFSLLNRKYNFKNDKDYAFLHVVGKQRYYTYSYRLVSKIIDLFTENSKILIDIKNEYKKKLTQGAKEF